MKRLFGWAIAPAALLLCATNADATAYVMNATVSFTGTPATGASYVATVTATSPTIASITKNDTVTGTVTFDQPFTIYDTGSLEQFQAAFMWDSQPTLQTTGTVTLLGVTGSTTGTTFTSQTGSGGIVPNVYTNLTNSSFSFTGFSYTVSITSGTGQGGKLSSFSAIGGSAPVPPPAVPEPASWLMMIGGFGLIGAALRRQKRAAHSLG